jgi:hypothetical protein
MSGLVRKLGIGIAGAIATSILLSNTLSFAQAEPLTVLPDGYYQLCSEPEPAPDDWRDGYGVCFVFEKVGQQTTGYYGYPHTDSFICLRGDLSDHQMEGEALFLSWAGNREAEEMPEEPIVWDDEGRLTLSQGELAYVFGEDEWGTVWFWFREAVLDLKGFYQYSMVRMNNPVNLCPWNQEKL